VLDWLNSQTVSIVFFTPSWRPDSFYDKILSRERGLHTLCLLDIRVKELTEEAICTNKKIYEPPRYMTVNTVRLDLPPSAFTLLLGDRRAVGGCIWQRTEGLWKGHSLCRHCENWMSGSMICYGTMSQLKETDFVEPLHTLIIPGDIHPIELEVLCAFVILRIWKGTA